MINTEKKPVIILIGPYPPRYGGISMHIYRLKKHLEQNNFKVIVYNTCKTCPKSIDTNVINIEGLKQFSYLIFPKADIIHLHTPHTLLRILVGTMKAPSRKTIISIHGESLSIFLKNANYIKKLLMKKALQNTSAIIALNNKIEDTLLSLGIPQGKIHVIPSFIPPIIEQKDFKKVPINVWKFIEYHKPIIVANAYKIVFYNGEDLYGIDMCIDLCAHLKKIYPKIGFVFALPDIGNYDYFKQMKNKIKEYKIEDNFLFQTKSIPLYPILMKSHLLVRPTNTDGDSVSVREALFFKIPVVASNVISRPEGTVLFKNRDFTDFYQKVLFTLNNYKKIKQNLEKIKTIDNSHLIMNLYKKLLSNDKQTD